MKKDYIPEFKYNVEDVTIGINEYIKLEVTTTPDQVDNRYLTYRSSDYEVASVDENGYIYANKSGNAIITVSYINEEKGIVITKEVKVKVITKVTSVEVEELVIVKQNETHKLEVTFEPLDAVDAIFTYESSDERVATIDENGAITALKAGTTIITIKCGNFIKYTFVSVVGSHYEESNIVKIINNENNVYALDNNGNVWSWGLNYKAPTIVNTNVKDIYGKQNGYMYYVYNDDWDGYMMTRIFELYNGKYCTVDVRNSRYEIIELEKRPVTRYVYEIKEKPLLN
jgi:uncharacterized protein YjdB